LPKRQAAFLKRLPAVHNLLPAVPSRQADFLNLPPAFRNVQAAFHKRQQAARHRQQAFPRGLPEVYNLQHEFLNRLHAVFTLDAAVYRPLREVLLSQVKVLNASYIFKRKRC